MEICSFFEEYQTPKYRFYYRSNLPRPICIGGPKAPQIESLLAPISIFIGVNPLMMVTSIGGTNVLEDCSVGSDAASFKEQSQGPEYDEPVASTAFY